MNDQTGAEAAERTDDLREQALAHLKARRDFTGHALTYVAVNSLLVAVWALGGADGLFWPIFPILGWGIGLGGHAWAVFGRSPFSEEQIIREEQRLRERGVSGRRPQRPG